MQWLDEYEKAPSTQTELIVKLEYFNTSSSKCLIDVFRRLEKLHNHGSEVHVQWYYEEEDEDMKESGEDFRDLVKMPVALVPIITDITEEQDR